MCVFRWLCDKRQDKERLLLENRQARQRINIEALTRDTQHTHWKSLQIPNKLTNRFSSATRLMRRAYQSQSRAEKREMAAFGWAQAQAILIFVAKNLFNYMQHKKWANVAFRWREAHKNSLGSLGQKFILIGILCCYSFSPSSSNITAVDTSRVFSSHLINYIGRRYCSISL